MKKSLTGRYEVLVYHQIGTESSPDGLTVSKEKFIEQMRFIRRHCHPAALADLIPSPCGKKKIPRKAVAVTFDDGYRDTFKTAFPILRKFKIPAAVFVTTGYVDRKIPMRKGKPLTWGMILNMQRRGIEIGCHTLTHPRLAECRPKEIKRQIEGSRRRLEEMLGKPVRFFAYPYGGPRSFNKAVQRSVRQAGFQAAFTTLSGSNGPGTSRYALRRIEPAEDSARAAVGELVRSARKKFSKEKKKIPGVSPRLIRIWSTAGRKLKKTKDSQSPFYWRIGHPGDC